MKTTEKKQRLRWCVIALTTLFIWGQSLMTRDISSAQSGALQGLLGSLFGEWIYSTFFYQHIRKVAHFAEYALLGAEWAGCRPPAKLTRHRIQWPIVCAGPLTAVLDELLQFISARAPRITDVLLDCAGYFFGMAMMLGLAALRRRIFEHSAINQ